MDEPHYEEIEIPEPRIRRLASPLDKKIAFEKWRMEAQDANREIKKMQEDKVKVFGVILGQLSRESIDQIKATKQGQAALENNDPLDLVKAIITTHLVSSKTDDNVNLYLVQK